jgi:hypothetical protein
MAILSPMMFNAVIIAKKDVFRYIENRPGTL